MKRLGVCYEYGNGVQKDIVEAATWYKRAADLGDEEARQNYDRLKNGR